MMQLTHITLVQWHLFDAEDIDLIGDVGIMGENRSGKSTVLDAIQAVITGGSREYIRLNASASETGKKRGGRTIHAYCLGRLGEGDATVRETALTCIVLTFRDTAGKRLPVSIGLVLEARRSESQEHVLARFVAQGVAVTTEDFMIVDDEGKRIQRSWEQVRERLETRVAEAGGLFRNHRDTVRDYVREYMRLVMTGGRYNDERRFLKSFVNALAFEHMKSATDFVRRFILEEKPIGIRELRESIATYREVRKIIGELKSKVASLEAIDADLQTFAAALEERDRQRWLGKRAAFLHGEQKYREAGKARQDARDAMEAAIGEIDRIDSAIAELDEQLDSIEGAIAASGVKDKKAVLTERQRGLTRQREGEIKHIADGYARLRRLAELRRLREAFACLPSFLALLEELDGETVGAEPPDWPQNPGAIDRLVIRLWETFKAAEKHLEAVSDRLIGALETERARRAELERQRERVARGLAPLDPATEAMCERLRSEGMAPRIVCELIDMKDESWRDAGEALLGRDREAILVKRDQVDKAFLVLRQNRREFRGVRIVNTRKLDGSARTAAPGTLASVITASDPLAIAFVVRRLGNVGLAESQADLHRPGRQVMRDGTYDDGLVVETRIAHDHKIGLRAAALMRERIEKGLHELGQAIGEKERESGFLREAMRRIDEARAHFESADSFDVLVGRADSLGNQLSKISEDIQNLDHLIDPKLLAEKKRLLTEHSRLRGERDTQLGEKAAQAKVIQQQDLIIGGGEGLEGSALYRNLHREAYRRVRRQMHYPAARALYRERLARHRSHAALAAAARSAERQADDRRTELDGTIRHALSAFFAGLGLRNEFGPESHLLAEIKPWVEQEIAFLRTNELTRYEAQATEAAERASVMFRNSFLTELRERFETVDREIRELNESLRNHPLHNERYSFHKSFHEGYRPIEQLVQLSQADDTLLTPLFQGTVPEGHPQREALEALERILLDESFDFAQFEDYRNFYVFDLVMEDVTTGRKTRWDVRRTSGSGAEQQVPFYVAIGAALASVYHGRVRGLAPEERGIGLAVFDEAFSKMDPKNQHQMLAFYRGIGLQTLTAGPSGNRGVFYENMDCVIEVLRFKDQAETDVRIVKERAREAMRAINPDNLTPEQLIARAAE